MIKEHINANTIIGTVVGVGVGRYVLKSKSVLFLTVFGVASGLLTNYLMNKYVLKSKEDKYLEEIENKMTIDSPVKEEPKESSEHVSDDLDLDIEKSSSFYGVNSQMEFNKQLGYHVNLDRTIPIEKIPNYMDLS